MPVRWASIGKETHRGGGSIDDPKMFRLKVRNKFLINARIFGKKV